MADLHGEASAVRDVVQGVRALHLAVVPFRDRRKSWTFKVVAFGSGMEAMVGLSIPYHRGPDNPCANLMF
jgi:hypothetical protein